MGKNVKAVLFDLDGTITDTERIYFRKWVQAAHQLGYGGFSVQEALDLRSLNHVDAAVMLRERFGPEFDHEAVHKRCGELVDQEITATGIPLKPGVMEILSFMKEKGIRNAVVTATAVERAKKRLTSLGLYDQFDRVISAHEVPKGKPHPDPYLYACEVLGEEPGDCIAVEDSPNGIRSAYQAGCRCVMIPDLTEPEGDISEMLTACVPSLMGLQELLTTGALQESGSPDLNLRS